MSLLMDALRKAEEAKRSHAAATDAASAAAPAEPGLAFELEPLANEVGSGPTPEHSPSISAPATPPSTPSPVSIFEADVLQADSTMPPPSLQQQPKVAPSPINTAAHRESAQNLFAAKQNTHGNRSFVVALAGFTTVAALCIGAYFWWQLQPKSSISKVSTLSSAPAAALPPLPMQALPPPAVSVPSETKTVFAHADTMLSSDKVISARIEAAPPAPPPSPIRIVSNRPKVSPLVMQAYDLLQQGNLSAAQQAYERVLSSEPKNADALYGLAAIALQNNRSDLAEDYYLRVLEADPRDAVAHAGLIGLHGKGNGTNTESRLKTLIADQPNVGALHFALGNLYAHDGRWREAQEAYFLAYKNDSETPDIVFNLAISLDHLHQEKLATQYYSEALRLAATRPSGFNRNQIQRRLRELQAQ